MLKKFFLRLIQRSPFFRFILIPLFFLLFILGISGITLLVHKKPVLESISPSIGEPGEILVLRGKYFGEEQGDNWIEIGGNRVSGTTFVKWTDNTIMTLLSPNVEDGLVYIVNRYGKSNPLIFANKANIPVAARVDTDLGLPEIASASTMKTETGKRLIIYGKNFGITKGSSNVLFSRQTDEPITYSDPSRENQLRITGSEHDFDYEFWSDIELRVRVPDGAASGSVHVQTERGLSNPLEIQIANRPGTKTYTKGHTYVFSIQVDISGVVASGGNTLFLRIPVPEESASQRDVEVTASSPKPYMDNYRGAILHQLENLASEKKEKITHSFLLTNYAVTTSINPSLVKPYTDKKSPLYMLYTEADRLVPSNTEEIIQQTATILGKETNPYNKAKRIYTWLTDTMQYAAPTNPDRAVLEALKEKSGDAYDMAILFAAFARATGIPAIPVAGVYVDDKQKSRLHWWAEFYIENFGWIPVDPGLEAEQKSSHEAEQKNSLKALSYFGNIDAAHIAFSRGYSEEKPMTANSRIVYKPRSFAFQTIWEESSGNLKSYTSFWGDPKITGVY